jgi:nucleotidyltransferase/DNA polymerase involved in DNA repair
VYLCTIAQIFLAVIVTSGREGLAKWQIAQFVNNERGEHAMEPLLSIIGVVAQAFGNEALNETARRTIGDLWEAAKKIIVAKFGSHPAPQLMDEMQRRPTPSAAEHVAAQLTALNVTSDPEVARVFRELADAAKRAIGTAPNVRAETVIGSQVSYGPVTINIPR